MKRQTDIIDHIETFHELMGHICWDWHETYLLEKDELGNFALNKTYITPTTLSYKLDRYLITNPMVFKKLEKFYELLQETEVEKALFHK